MYASQNIFLVRFYKNSMPLKEVYTCPPDKFAVDQTDIIYVLLLNSQLSKWIYIDLLLINSFLINRLKVQMKCFFLFPNLKEQQKSGRLPFTVS